MERDLGEGDGVGEGEQLGHERHLDRSIMERVASLHKVLYKLQGKGKMKEEIAERKYKEPLSHSTFHLGLLSMVCYRSMS